MNGDKNGCLILIAAAPEGFVLLLWSVGKADSPPEAPKSIWSSRATGISINKSGPSALSGCIEGAGVADADDDVDDDTEEPSKDSVVEEEFLFSENSSQLLLAIANLEMENLTINCLQLEAYIWLSSYRLPGSRYIWQVRVGETLCPGRRGFIYITAQSFFASHVEGAGVWGKD